MAIHAGSSKIKSSYGGQLSWQKSESLTHKKNFFLNKNKMKERAIELLEYESLLFHNFGQLI